MRHLMQFANARGWRPQREGIFGKKYLFSCYQPCLICKHMTRGDNSKCKKLSKRMQQRDAVSFPLPGCHFPAPKRSQREWGSPFPVRSREEELPPRLSPSTGPSLFPASPCCGASGNKGSQPVAISKCPSQECEAD